MKAHQKEATAFATLKIDGYFKKTSSNISMVPSKQVQSVDVAVDGLVERLEQKKKNANFGG
ncbi:uncharacterized protein PHALS_12757 [Plasmopara halstedii]|uniref:Uncharacterized protein n=1 Tax=Plasmopara halstedii TaxID=4781 RepID=A0A0P1AN73_PLAHL|nr:uncharacterized protein PHALS_12757 [Plasmopara halstedii]CEG42487.1 hypothetical protein PHALS_12757 [Plasmopara halstedii]|eukprot:XP_024578856.1 hypothetical protein PHALS_12757 [Plasmopara halstedii]